MAEESLTQTYIEAPGHFFHGWMAKPASLSEDLGSLM